MTRSEQAVAEARYKYDRIQQDIGFDPGDPRLMADGTYKEADRLFAELVAHLRRMHFQEAADYIDRKNDDLDALAGADPSDTERGESRGWAGAASFLRGVQ